MSNFTDRTETREVTIRRETRTVTFTVRRYHESGREMCIDSDARGAFCKGGGKVWFRRLDFITNNGRTDWTVRTNEVFLNRNGYRLIDWADNVEGQNDSEHNSA